MEYIIGVDGGGTGCRVAVADMTGHVLGAGKAGAANIATDLTSARANILLAIETAFNSGGLNPENIQNSSAVLGLAGSNFGSYAAELSRDLPLKSNHIVNDSRITLEGAVGESNGCVAAIGTGSVFTARGKDGIHMRGGWGFLLGDDGSGAALGRDLLRLTLLAADGVRSHSDLTRDILVQYDNKPETIVESARQFSPRDFGQFAPQIVAAAADNDSHAAALMMKHTELVQSSIDACGFDPEKPFCMLGGLGPTYLNYLPEKYRNAATAPKGNALSGALKMAEQRFSKP